MSIVNLSAYRFVSLDELPLLRESLLERSLALGLKGTILLAPEGINLFVAGARAEVDAFMACLRQDPRFARLQAKESLSDTVPFGRMRVRLKQEIITLRAPTLCPESGRAPALPPTTLQRWLDQGHDDAGREVVLLDTRNAYETAVGKFAGAVDYSLASFTGFIAALAADRARYENKTVVSYCTGGIRCEKAALHMQELGLRDVYQLDGGILNYLEHTSGAHWQGDCFVFDERGAIDKQLLPLPPLPAGERNARAPNPLPTGERVGVRGHAGEEPASKQASIDTHASTRPSPLRPAQGGARSSPRAGEEVTAAHALLSGERVGVRGRAGEEPASKQISIDALASTRPSPRSSPRGGEEVVTGEGVLPA